MVRTSQTLTNAAINSSCRSARLGDTTRLAVTVLLSAAQPICVRESLLTLLRCAINETRHHHP